MKLLFYATLLIIVISCSNSTVKVYGADGYIETITGFTCEKAIVTDNGFLVIAIDAIQGTDYNSLASQFLDEAQNEGVSGLKGVYIVDIKNCQFGDGWVTGDRIGRAYK